MLTFHYGAMRGGKSAHLIGRVADFKKNSISTAIFSTMSDEVSSRNGKSLPAKNTEGVDFKKFHEQNPHIEVIIIDECQFLTKRQVFQIVRLSGIEIFVYGMRTSMEGYPFKSSAYLLSYADNLISIKRRCENDGCEQFASMSLVYDKNRNLMRKWNVSDDEIKDLRWKSVCQACFWREFETT